MSALEVQNDEIPPSLIAARDQGPEDIVIGAALDWVILCLRNALLWWAAQLRRGDVVPGPYPNSTAAPIHERDLALAAARALREQDLLGRSGH